MTDNQDSIRLLLEQARDSLTRINTEKDSLMRTIDRIDAWRHEQSQQASTPDQHAITASHRIVSTHEFQTIIDSGDTIPFDIAEVRCEQTIDTRAGLSIIRRKDQNPLIIRGTPLLTGPLIKVNHPNVTFEGVEFQRGIGRPEPAGDCLALTSGASGFNMRRCTLLWSTDELFDAWGSSIDNVTIENCLFAEALHEANHLNGKHSMGMLCANPDRTNPVGYGWRVTNNVFAHNDNRNPQITAENLLFAHNVILKSGSRGIQAFLPPYTSQYYFNNLVLHTKGHGAWGSANIRLGEGARLYSTGNFNNTTRPSDTIAERLFWNTDDGGNSVTWPDALPAVPVIVRSDLANPNVMDKRALLLDHVLSDVGASTVHTSRIIDDVRHQRGGLVNAPPVATS